MRAKILDQRFKYVSAAATNVQETWRKFGWKPTSELTRADNAEKLQKSTDSKSNQK